MTNTSSESAPPRIEALLSAAHRDLDAIRERCKVIELSGIVRDHLPDDLELRAFALLGDHERDRQLEQARPHWPELQSKGLAQGSINDATTAELRLLMHALPHIQAIDSVWSRLAAIERAPVPPLGTLRCATQVRGQWGQPARVHFAAQDVRHMLISPEAVFGLQPALVAAEPDGQTAGAFVIPIDNGEIAITLLHRSGEVFRHVVQTMVEEVA